MSLLPLAGMFIFGRKKKEKKGKSPNEILKRQKRDTECQRTL